MEFKDEVFELDEASGNLFCKHCGENYLRETHKDDCSEYPGVEMGREKVKPAPPKTAVTASPNCPTCGKTMIWTQYRGYYDSFQYWACGCEDGANKVEDEWAGGYV